MLFDIILTGMFGVIVGWAYVFIKNINAHD
jgi:hypothetical protein